MRKGLRPYLSPYFVLAGIHCYQGGCLLAYLLACLPKALRPWLLNSETGDLMVLTYDLNMTPGSSDHSALPDLAFLGIILASVLSSSIWVLTQFSVRAATVLSHSAVAGSWQGIKFSVECPYYKESEVGRETKLLGGR